MTFDLDIFVLLVHLDTIWVKLEGQGHRSEFTVTERKKSPLTTAGMADRRLGRTEIK